MKFMNNIYRNFVTGRRRHALLILMVWALCHVAYVFVKTNRVTDTVVCAALWFVGFPLFVYWCDTRAE